MTTPSAIAAATSGEEVKETVLWLRQSVQRTRAEDDQVVMLHIDNVENAANLIESLDAELARVKGELETMTDKYDRMDEAFETSAQGNRNLIAKLTTAEAAARAAREEALEEAINVVTASNAYQGDVDLAQIVDAIRALSPTAEGKVSGE